MRQTITFRGRGISLNTFYKSGFWKERNDAKNEYAEKFKALFAKAKLKPVDTFKLTLTYNSRHDVDNVVGMSKIFVDTLNNVNLIKDDNPKYYKQLVLRYDSRLKHNTFKFVLENAN
jgi:hypothetical protein